MYLIRSKIKSEKQNFPEELKADYNWVIEKLTNKNPVFDEGSVRGTLFGMHTKTAVKIAEKILLIRNLVNILI